MDKSDSQLEAVVRYMKAHWPSKVKPEWQVGLDEYPAILKRIVSEFTVDASRNRNIIRVAGLSGSGKTTQILPAVDAYCEKNGLKPVLIAARRFVEYHPHYVEIKDNYGEENLRKMTDEFSTIMLFLTISGLVREGYDIVLDVTLLDPEIEKILLEMVNRGKYDLMILMIATSPIVTEHFLREREWRHTKETEEEFIRATAKALKFYADAAPDTRIVLWSVYDLGPVYDGPISECLEVFANYSQREELPRDDDDERREAKIKYLIAG